MNTDRPPEPESFRDSIPTVDAAGKRIWIYPKKPLTGKRASPDAVNFYQYRNWLSWFLLVFLFAGPFIRINGNPILMMNIVERKFSILGVMFWPQDLHLVALMMITGMVMLVLFTAVFGRIWCGWVCPQTVLMELLFRKIEYAIEGDAAEQKRLDEQDWDPEKIRKKSLKHGIFLLLSFLISNLLLAYVIGSDALIELITDPPQHHIKGLTAMVLFTFMFYKLFARFREQACTFICPYGRFQSVLLDPNSIVVAYDYLRGENRGRKKRGQSMDDRKLEGLGDCVDCNLCVAVCPTGIDIRNGTQMECVNCAVCIDACNSVMNRLKLPSGLIRYASENNIKNGEKLRFTPRIGFYTALLTVLVLVLSILLAQRTSIETDILRLRGTLYQTQPDGEITNLFQARVTNKTQTLKQASFTLLDKKGSVRFAGDLLDLPPLKDEETILIVSLKPSEFEGEQTPFRIGLEIDGETIQEVNLSFLSPPPEQGK